MQFERELSQSLVEVLEELHCVGVVLEPNDGVVGVAHDDDVATCIPLPPLLGPKVEDVVQEHVRQEGRDRCSLWRTLHCLRPPSVFDHPSGKPLSQQPQEAFVRDPVLEKFGSPAGLVGAREGSRGAEAEA